MKILILSDSHGCVEAMETIVAREKPQAMVHLGDLWADGKQLGKLFPDIPLYQVAGTVTAMAGNRGRTKSEPSPWTMW